MKFKKHINLNKTEKKEGKKKELKNKINTIANRYTKQPKTYNTII